MIHKELASGRWYEFSFAMQLANVGADIGRTIKWKNKGKLEISKDTFASAIELLDLTISDPKNKSHRARELKTVRETLLDYFVGTNEYQSTDEAWENYFMFFNWIAAQERGR